MPDICDKRNNWLRKTRFPYNGYRLTACRRGLRFSLVLKHGLETWGVASP